MLYIILFAICLVAVVGIIAHGNHRSPEMHRDRTHDETTVVMYESAVYLDDYEYGILDAWWQMSDGSILMRLLPCDIEGNLENSEPVMVTNDRVEGWWPK